MLIIKKNQINNLIATVSMNKTLPNPYYLFSFQHIASKTRVSFIPETVMSNTRYDKFRFKEGGNVNLSITPPEVYFEYLGQYYYSIYEQLSPTNTDIALAYNKLESGRAVVIVGDANPDACFFEPYISDDEEFANVIYMSEEEDYCISGDTSPECVPSMTGGCPTFLTRYSPTNSLYYKNTGDTANFISSFDTCAITQIAMDDTRMFLSDGCSNYYQFDYTISSGGCFSQTLVNTWDVWASSGTTPNASYTMGIYDANNLIIGESQQYVLQTGSTLYLYNLTTSGLTKWLEIGGGAQVSNIYYNTGNTQMVTSYNIASGNTGFYALYSGAVNPQLVATIPVVYSNGGSTMYFSGNTPIAVNSAGLQYALDFTAGTMNIITKPNTIDIPQLYVSFDDGYAYMGTIAQPVSCYTFDIQTIPVTPTPTPSFTPTMTMTPTNTSTPTSTPTNTPTNTPSPTPPPSDADANLYLSAVVNAGGTGITPTVSAATTNMFISLKNEGLYNKIDALYPFLGGIAASCKFNAKNPVDTNAAFRLTFGGGSTFSQAKGFICNGVNSYADTYWVQSAETNAHNTSLGLFVSQTGTTGFDIGATNSTQWVALDTSRLNNLRAAIETGLLNLTGQTPSQAINFNAISRNSNSTISFVARGSGVQTLSSAGTTTLQGLPIYIGVVNGFGEYTDSTYGTAFIGDGLNSTQLESLNNIITTFNTTLGRNI